jgi:hypothetical protein
VIRSVFTAALAASIVLGTTAQTPSPKPKLPAASRAGRAFAALSSVSPAQLQARLGGFRASLVALRPAAPAASGNRDLAFAKARTLARAPFSNGVSSAVSNRLSLAQGDLEFVGLLELMPPNRGVDTSKPLALPNGYFMVARSTDPAIPSTNGITYSVAVPDCNLNFTVPGGVWNPRQPGGTEAVPRSVLGAFAYAPYVLGFVPSGWGDFPIGVNPHRLTVRYPVGAHQLVASFVVQSHEDFQQSFVAVMDENGALAKDGGLGMTAANIQYRVPGLGRVNTGALPVAGMDVIGKGIALGPGVTGNGEDRRSSLRGRHRRRFLAGQRVSWCERHHPAEFGPARDRGCMACRTAGIAAVRRPVDLHGPARSTPGSVDAVRKGVRHLTADSHRPRTRSPIAHAEHVFLADQRLDRVEPALVV